MSKSQDEQSEIKILENEIAELEKQEQERLKQLTEELDHEQAEYDASVNQAVKDLGYDKLSQKRLLYIAAENTVLLQVANEENEALTEKYRSIILQAVEMLRSENIDSNAHHKLLKDLAKLEQKKNSSRGGKKQAETNHQTNARNEIKREWEKALMAGDVKWGNKHDWLTEILKLDKYKKLGLSFKTLYDELKYPKEHLPNLQ